MKTQAWPSLYAASIKLDHENAMVVREIKTKSGATFAAPLSQSET
jgi:hypothetical protein